MAHEIDTLSLGRASIAYAGEAPWHKLGTRMLPGMTIPQWIEAAGLDWEAREALVEFSLPDGTTSFVPGMKVLYRSDTQAALSVVGADYKVVQPAKVMEFFAEITRIGGFEMESAGVLAGGRRIWALAKVNDGAQILPGDVVKPYVLLATSFDGTMATTGRLTSVRVVCQNTLSLSEYASSGRSIRVAHHNDFDPTQARLDLGIYADGFEAWLIKARRMAEREINLATASDLVTEVCSHVMPREATQSEIRQSPAYQRVMELFDGTAIGWQGHTVWTLLNSVTQYVDHDRGRQGDARRFGSAMMGAGDRLKTIAHSRLIELV